MNTTNGNTANYLNSSITSGSNIPTSGVPSSSSSSSSSSSTSQAVPTNPTNKHHYHSNSYHHGGFHHHHHHNNHNHHHHCSSYQMNNDHHDSQLSAASATLPATPSTSSKKIFGVDLRQLELSQVGCNDQYLIVPSFLKFSIEYVSDFVNQEGIFRRNGTQSRLKELKVNIFFS